MAKVLRNITMTIDINDEGVAESISFNYTVQDADDPRMRKGGAYEMENPNFSSGIRTVVSNVLPLVKALEGMPDE